MANVEINDLDLKATPARSDEAEGQTAGGGASFKATFGSIVDEALKEPGAIGGTTPGDGYFDDVTISAAKHLLLPQHSDAVTPTLAFGDGDTGFYESSDDKLQFAMGGNNRWVFTSSLFETARIKSGISLSFAQSPPPMTLPALADAIATLCFE